MRAVARQFDLNSVAEIVEYPTSWRFLEARFRGFCAGGGRGWAGEGGPYSKALKLSETKFHCCFVGFDWVTGRPLPESGGCGHGAWR